MNIHDIVSDWGIALLPIIWTAYRDHRKKTQALGEKIESLERKVLAVVVMLHSHGLKIPSQEDTDRFFRKK